MANTLLALLLGTSAAASWAIGDFSGGLSSRKFNPHSVVIFSQFFGLMFLLALILLLSDPIMPLSDIFLSLLAGFFLSIGLTYLYRGIAEEQVGVVAPLSAIIAASLPAVAGFITEGLPQLNEILGIILAMICITVVSAAGNEGTISISALKTPIIAGVSFSVFKIIIAFISSSSLLWPLFLSRISSIVFLVAFSYTQKQLQKPTLNFAPIFGFVGILDASGGLLFLLAVQYGRLDIAAVFSSTHPVFTVFLAFILMKEKIYQVQWAGIVGILVAMILISL